MSKRRFASVWDPIEDTAAEVESMRARAQLMNEIIALITKQHLTQAEAAKRLGVTQPRISDLMRGKVDLFSLDTLVDMLALAGRRVEMKVKRERALA
jgi:predicted XRE-type DNA-binding protein